MFMFPYLEGGFERASFEDYVFFLLLNHHRSYLFSFVLQTAANEARLYSAPKNTFYVFAQAWSHTHVFKSTLFYPDLLNCTGFIQWRCQFCHCRTGLLPASVHL